jgi:hypothetical protein
MNASLEESVVAFTKERIASFTGPSFHEDRKYISFSPGPTDGSDLFELQPPKQMMDRHKERTRKW